MPHLLAFLENAKISLLEVFLLGLCASLPYPTEASPGNLGLFTAIASQLLACSCPALIPVLSLP